VQQHRRKQIIAYVDERQGRASFTQQVPNPHPHPSLHP
jgi:hypothetical protein